MHMFYLYYQPSDLFSQVFRESMPPKRGHGHGDEDVGEGSSTVKKIKIVRGKEFVCEYCGDILETAGNLKNHKKKHQTFECQNKSATNASLWKTSKDTLSVAKAQEKAFFFMCEECGESLPTLHKLDKHKSILSSTTNVIS